MIRWIVGMLSVLTPALTVAVIVLALNLRAAIERAIGVSVAPAADNQIMPVDFYWTDYHADALATFTSREHARSILGELEDGSSTRDEMIQRVSRDDNSSDVRMSLSRLEEVGWVRSGSPFKHLLELGDEGRGVMNALRQIPDWLMDFTNCVNWRFSKVDCTAEVPDDPPEFAKQIRLLIDEMQAPR